MDEVVTGKYKITGFVQKLDQDGNASGELEIGSVHELPLEFGAQCVEAGTAELVEEDARETETVEEDGETGETGEGAVLDE